MPMTDKRPLSPRGWNFTDLHTRDQRPTDQSQEPQMMTTFGTSLSPRRAHDGFASHMSSAGQVDGRVNAGKTLGVIELSEQTVIEQLVDRLTNRYPAIAQSVVARVVLETHARFEGRPVRDFIPLLVERNAKSALDRLGASAG
jgi:hypothetical protein